ncbi:hypothetical protein ACIB24_08140 [Spongisporangium articulatum]|uniref:Uncharacterized protein n=1 Tax=Spongisporangium articulatum TaxID=3362603 RepID=A0ABW8AKY5_9ACTN
MLALTLAAAAEQTERELPAPTWAFGVGALAVFALLFMVTWFFRGNSSKH